MKAALAIMLLSMLTLSGCGESQCDSKRQEYQALLEEAVAKVKSGDVAGSIIAQGKAEDLKRGDYWVCFRQD